MSLQAGQLLGPRESPALRASVARHGSAGDLPRYSPLLAGWFAGYLRRYFARHFDAVRVSREGRIPRDTDRPLIVYANHPSWWDPIHFMLLASAELPDRRMYGPMDAAALERYRMFERLGAFGIERGTRRGTVKFVRASLAILAEPGASLWMTAEGEFADPRRRPMRLRSGLAHLVRRLDDACVVPLAVEYPFWDERRPEALTRFGEPFVLSREPRRSVEAWTARLEERLAETMDSLAEESATRDPERFRTIVRGTAGVGGVYDAWRRLRGLLHGQRIDLSHGQNRR